MAEKVQRKIPYGDWGYGIQTPIADKMEAKITESKNLMKDQPNSRIYYFNKGIVEALEEFMEDVSEVESSYSNSIVKRLNDERHSGFGRGDSMG